MKYLKTKAYIIENNIAEELGNSKLPKRIPKYLNLEESVRLLLECKNSPRDHCIITIFLNCALRLSELASLNINQINNDILSVVDKGNKECKTFLMPAAKKLSIIGYILEIPSMLIQMLYLYPKTVIV